MNNKDREILSRLDERVKNISIKLDELRLSFKELCGHVNDELVTMDVRVRKIEEQNIKDKTEKRILKMVISALGGVLGGVSTTLGILALLRII